LPEQRPLGHVGEDGRKNSFVVIAEQEKEDRERKAEPCQTGQKVAFHVEWQPHNYTIDTNQIKIKPSFDNLF
jgi:hypothetical protein